MNQLVPVNTQTAVAFNYDVAITAIAECLRVDEVVMLGTKAAMLQEYARRAKNRDMEVNCAEIRARAERRFAELCAQHEDVPLKDRAEYVGGFNTYYRCVRHASVSPERFEKGIKRWKKRALNTPYRVSIFDLKALPHQEQGDKRRQRDRQAWRDHKPAQREAVFIAHRVSGRSIGSICLGEIRSLLDDMRKNSKILRAIQSHVSDANMNLRIDEALTAKQLENFIKASE